MNTVLLLIIAVPTIEIFLMIKIGQNIGALNTIALIFLTAFIFHIRKFSYIVIENQYQ